MTTNGRLGRNFLKGPDGDRVNATLVGAGYDDRVVFKWPRRWLSQMMPAILKAIWPPRPRRSHSPPDIRLLHGRFMKIDQMSPSAACPRGGSRHELNQPRRIYGPTIKLGQAQWWKSDVRVPAFWRKSTTERVVTGFRVSESIHSGGEIIYWALYWAERAQSSSSTEENDANRPQHDAQVEHKGIVFDVIQIELELLHRILD